MSDQTIILKGNFRSDEGLASGTVKPGHLLEQTSAAAKTFKVHATEGGYAERCVAVEDALQGDTIDDSYADAALVQVAHLEPGAEVQMWAFGTSNISIGELLISNADGTLIPNGDEASSTTVKQIIAVALETFNQTASALIKVRLL